MKYVDMEKSPRRNTYNLFRQMDYPHCSLCANVDVTRLYEYSKRCNLSFFKAMLYIAAKTANDIKEFRFRIQGEKVVEYEVVHPSYVLLTKEDAFNFCTVEFENNFMQFYKDAVLKAEELQGNIDWGDEPDRDDLLYITCIPWVSFMSILHPVNMNPVDSIPRIAWGKYFDEGESKKMPLGVQAHHSLVDGLHIGKYYNAIQQYLDNPEMYLDGVK
ncbi:chloramphenicol O-acetyltransferase type A [Anaerobacterium chartisolvens]|uniref:Chloramphenicol O-acetyltransferase type A n=1 Tax=Anaerobacterium chartisolvens TaxID=1297424 RepID=A0A369AX71_9FIRM|nr:chloramphenicol acetyltransferase [Anaerobacterium chartisolvens]RCX13889.1 chloramphenicol O-acetyltransferase type A [Anaerobacterium chartisolvens]